MSSLLHKRGLHYDVRAQQPGPYLKGGLSRSRRGKFAPFKMSRVCGFRLSFVHWKIAARSFRLFIKYYPGWFVRCPFSVAVTRVFHRPNSIVRVIEWDSGLVFGKGSDCLLRVAIRKLRFSRKMYDIILIWNEYFRIILRLKIVFVFQHKQNFSP